MTELIVGIFAAGCGYAIGRLTGFLKVCIRCRLAAIVEEQQKASCYALADDPRPDDFKEEMRR